MPSFALIYSLVLIPSALGGIKSVYEDSSVRVQLISGAFAFEEDVVSHTFTEQGSSLEWQPRKTQITSGTHLSVQIRYGEGEDSINDRAQAALLANRFVALVELSAPGVIRDKLFEGFLVSPDGSRIIEHEGPVEFRDARLYPKKETMESVSRSIRHLAAQDPERFDLACRWFIRGRDAVNLADKLLFWWTVLEIFPAKNTSKVPESVCELIQQECYPQLKTSEIKSRTGVGRLFGMRSKVVHDGQAFLEDNDETPQRMRQLEALVYTCLRSLGSLPLGNELDEWCA